MGRKKTFIYCVIGVSLFITSVIAYAETGVIRFASGVYPPFTILKGDRVLYGFDIDVAKALCDKMRVRCSFSYDRFVNMASSLKNDKYDAWISAISIGDEHQQQAIFTEPYFSSNASLIATKDTFFNAAPVEIKGKTIGVADRTCYVQFLQNTYGNTINIKIFPTEQDSFMALKKGVVDAVIDDETVIRRWRLEQNDKKKYRLIGLPAKYSGLVWHQYGIAVAKDNQELVEKLNNAISRIKTDGTYDRIVKKYFPI